MKYIDLGLSVLWADCNIGANSPEEYGEYYKWDDIPREYEVPTREQQDELRRKCTWKWTTRNGVYGYKVTSKVNGNSIFLPAAGYRSGDYLNDVGSYGYYWSSSLYKDISYDVYYLNIDSDFIDWHYCHRYYKQSVRTIKSKTTIKNKTTAINVEIDILAPDKLAQNYIFCECKFTNQPFDLQELKNLQNKVFVKGNIYFYLFSVFGFTNAVQEAAANNQNIVLIDATELLSFFV